MNAKLVYVVLHLERPRLDVVVTDTEGYRRKVAVRWLAKQPGSTPPADWPQMVDEEVRLQVAEDKARASGRLLIR